MRVATETVSMPPQRHPSRRSYPAHNTFYSGSPSSHDSPRWFGVIEPGGAAIEPKGPPRALDERPKR